MTTITYTVTDDVNSNRGIKRISYGIEVYTDTGAAAVASIRDITSDRAKLDTLVRQCNDLQLSPIHLYDVIEDLITN